jgi:hypothetical protein
MIETGNQSFDTAVRFLNVYHPIVNLGGQPAMDFTKQPKLKASEWKYYFQALHAFLLIGNRNNWTRTHLDKWGFPTWVIIEKVKP